MRIRLLSDLHFEFEEEASTRDFVDSLAFDASGAADTCVLAGDIATVAFFERVEMLVERWPDVTFHWLFGNHEYYGSSFAETENAAARLFHAHANLRPLDRYNTPLPLVGTTLWYPNPRDMRSWLRWSDTNHIKDPFRIFYEAGADYEFLFEQALRDNVHAIATHMLPNHACVAPAWQGVQTNEFFVHDCSRIIQEASGLKVWMFGHTHECMDFEKDGIRFICNPRGYPRKDQGRNGFDPLKEIEV